MSDDKIYTILQEMGGLLVRLSDLTAKLAAQHPELAQDVQLTQQLGRSVSEMLRLQRTNQ